MIPESIRGYLETSGVAWACIEHPLAIDGSHLAQVLGRTGHRVAKCVVVEGGDGERIIVALPASSKLDLAAVSSVAGQRVELASEATLSELFPGCEIGAAPPLGKLFELPLMLDVALARPGPILFRGGTHEDAIEMDYVDFADLEDPLVAAVSYEGEALAGGAFYQGALTDSF